MLLPFRVIRWMIWEQRPWFKSVTGNRSAILIEELKPWATGMHGGRKSEEMPVSWGAAHDALDRIGTMYRELLLGQLEGGAGGGDRP